MDSSEARNSRKEAYTHKNIDPKISTIRITYIHLNNIQKSTQFMPKTKEIQHHEHLKKKPKQ